MKRIQLIALITTALLSTSVHPETWLETVPPSPDLIEDAAVPPVSAAPTERLPFTAQARTADKGFTQPDEPEDLMIDEATIELLYSRLSNRHTALSDRERRRVAETILEQARRYDLNPELVIAVIEVESAGYALAVSHVGARGLMQLMPATGEEVARKLGIPWQGEDTLFDPVVNVRLGTYYLRQLADYYGNVTVALAAYNWGPGAIDRRIESGKTVPALYIEKVMAAYDRGAIQVASNAY